jgi:hypothetical protein
MIDENAIEKAKRNEGKNDFAMYEDSEAHLSSYSKELQPCYGLSLSIIGVIEFASVQATPSSDNTMRDEIPFWQPLLTLTRRWLTNQLY